VLKKKTKKRAELLFKTATEQKKRKGYERLPHFRMGVRAKKDVPENEEKKQGGPHL